MRPIKPGDTWDVYPSTPEAWLAEIKLRDQNIELLTAELDELRNIADLIHNDYRKEAWEEADAYFKGQSSGLAALMKEHKELISALSTEAIAKDRFRKALLTVQAIDPCGAAGAIATKALAGAAVVTEAGRCQCGLILPAPGYACAGCGKRPAESEEDSR